MASVSSCLSSIQQSLKENNINPHVVSGTVAEYFPEPNNNYGSLILIEKTQQETYQIRVYLPRFVLMNLEDSLCDGQKIEVTGKLSIFRSQLQIIAQEVNIIESTPPSVIQTTVSRPSKKLPEIISNIAVITSKSSEVYGDFIHNLRYGQVQIFETKMQGISLPHDIAEQIAKVSQSCQYDCICILRGGGNSVDLEEFNSPFLATAIQNSHIPVLTAIGHHVNEFLCDKVADNPQFFSTPTALANYLTKHHDNLKTDCQSKIRQIDKMTYIARFPYREVVLALITIYAIYLYLIK